LKVVLDRCIVSNAKKIPTLIQLISLVTLTENHSELGSEWRVIWESGQAGFQKAMHNAPAHSPRQAVDVAFTGQQVGLRSYSKMVLRNHVFVLSNHIISSNNNEKGVKGKPFKGLSVVKKQGRYLLPVTIRVYRGHTDKGLMLFRK